MEEIRREFNSILTDTTPNKVSNCCGGKYNEDYQMCVECGEHCGFNIE